MYDTTTPHQDLMPMRNPNVEGNTRRQKGSKLVFDGVELPSVRRISARQTRSGGEDGNEADESMELENGTNTAARRKAPRGRRIAKQRKGATAASDRVQILLEQPFARCEVESSLSRGTSPSAYCTVG